MKEIVYAIKNINTGELVSKRNGNPFYVSKYQANEALKYCNTYRNWAKNKYKLVKYRLEEVDDEI